MVNESIIKRGDIEYDRRSFNRNGNGKYDG